MMLASQKLHGTTMRFQQKQLQEREQKKLALSTPGVVNNPNPATARNASIGNGKVREMFERRRGAGIDRSHPLKPIATTSTVNLSTSKSTLTAQQAAALRRLAGGGAPAATSRRTVVTTKQANNLSSMHSSQSHPESFASNGNLFGNDLDEMDNLESETFPKEFSSLSLDNTRIMGAAVHDGNNNLNKSHNGIGRRDIMDATITISKRTNTNGIKLNPVVMKKSPNITTGSKTARSVVGQQRTASGSTGRVSLTSRNSTMSTNGSATTPTPTANRSPAVKKPAATTTTPGAKGVKIMPKAANVKPSTFALAVKPPPRVVTPPPGMATCPNCQRNFNEDRLEKHEEVCRKMMAKKRKIFDASKHRVQGTEAEKFVKKGANKTTAATASVQKSFNVSHSSNNNSAAVESKKPNWRKKHEEFITAIREAKKIQAFLAKGGNIRDLPPPKPSENPDYVQCPHCSRRFNETAAERHIPKCANMKHNKPKPPVQKKRY